VDSKIVGDLMLAQKAAEYWRNQAAKAICDEGVDTDLIKNINPHVAAYLMYAALAGHMATVLEGTNDMAKKALEKIKQDKLDEELQKGLEDILTGKTHTFAEVQSEMKERFGI